MLSRCEYVTLHTLNISYIQFQEQNIQNVKKILKLW